MLYVSISKKSIIHFVVLVFFALISYDFAFADFEDTDRIVTKYEKWKNAVNDPQNTAKVFGFFYNNPHWPLFDQSVREAEKNAKARASKQMVMKWFKRYSPKTKEGLEIYINYLLEDNPEFAKNYIKQT